MNEKLLSGTVDMLVLQSVAAEPSYGYAITRDVLHMSGDRISLTKGALYLALHRLERQGALVSEWQVLPSGRRRKYYRLTGEGQTLLERKRKHWYSFSGALDKLLGSAR
jgi:DNA-binding PadR family transcriptional regulator